MYDAIVIGGSYAGLSAAMQLARARRKVCIVDSGEPRNRFAPQSHGFFGMDGMPPAQMLQQGRDKVLAYPSVSLQQGRVESAQGRAHAFELALADGTRLEARRLVLAYGVRDVLPDLPGLQERWGVSVLHCPYCHGYEFADHKLGVLGVSPLSPMQAQLISDWGPTTYFQNGQPEPDGETLQRLQARNVTIERTPVVGVEGTSPQLSAVRLQDGRTVAIDALYVGASFVPRSLIGEQLGCAFEAGPLGPFLRTDDRRQTTVAGVYAAGDIARAFHNATMASADGVMAGAFAHQSLIFQ